MDQLSEVLAEVRANAVVTGHFTLEAPWAFLKQAVQGIPFRICRGAPCYLQVEGSPPLRLESGDVVLLPHGSPHRMGSDLSHPAVSFDSLLAERGIVPDPETPLRLSAHLPSTEDDKAPGDLCELHTAIVGFPSAHRHPLFEILPPVIHIRRDDPAVAPWLRTTLQTFIEESMACEPGWMVAAARLCDVLCVQMVRGYVLGQSGTGPHWLKALLDRQVGKVVLAIHRNPAAAWDMQQFAELACMSRSRFIARFTALVGKAPMAHLTDVRMHAAAAALATGSARVSEIADQAGYTSEKAFSRAFKRWAGDSPREYRQRTVDLLDAG